MKPELRFLEFEENWSYKKLKDLLKVHSGRDYKHLEPGEIPVYGTGGYMLSVSDYLSNDDAIGIGRKGTINKPYLLKAPFWTVDTLFYCTPREEVDLYFLLSLFKKINWEKYDESTGVPSLSKVNIEKLKVYSCELEEQRKIGDFFSKLDQQIELEEKKLAKLEEQKKGYMQKIFSQELRFKDKKDDYYSDWESYQLKDLTYYKNGKGYEKVATTNGKYNIINLNSIGVKGQLKDSGKYTDFEDDTLLKNDLIMILSDVAKGNLIGMSAIIDENNKYLLNQRIALLRIENSLITNAYFLYLYINLNRKYFINMSTGMSQLNINKKTVEDFPVNLPNIEEQNKIAILFKNYEDNIKKQASKVKLLKQRKKGLLQKMFV